MGPRLWMIAALRAAHHQKALGARWAVISCWFAMAMIRPMKLSA